MQQHRGINQTDAAASQQPAQPAAAAWQFLRPGEVPAEPAAVTPVPQPEVTAASFQFVRPGQPVQQPAYAAAPVQPMATATMPVLQAAPAAMPIQQAAPAAMPVQQAAPAAAPVRQVALVSSHASDCSSEEFSRIIDRKIVNRRRKNRRSFIVTLVLFFGSTGGGAAWFVSSPDRVTAFKTVVSELKSVTDVRAMKEKYDKALAKIGQRKHQIDDAAAMIGVDPHAPVSNEDAHFDKEMREMMGEDGGPTMGERNRNFTATVDKLKKAGLIKDPTAEEKKD